MIYDTLNKLPCYLGISENMDKAIRFLMEYVPGENARMEVDGKNVYGYLSEPGFLPAEEAKWEAHKNYIDIHVEYKAGESVGVCALNEIKAWGEYNAEKDVVLSDQGGVGSLVCMVENSFLVTFPWDAHKPRIGEGTGRKLILKVLCDVQEG